MLWGAGESCLGQGMSLCPQNIGHPSQWRPYVEQTIKNSSWDHRESGTVENSSSNPKCNHLMLLLLPPKLLLFSKTLLKCHLL